MIEMVIALSLVGAIAGVIAELFGVGGSMILVPAFNYAFTTLSYADQDLMQICLATSFATIVVVGASVEAGLDEFDDAAECACADGDRQQAKAACAGQREGERREGNEVHQLFAGLRRWGRRI